MELLEIFCKADVSLEGELVTCISRLLSDLCRAHNMLQAPVITDQDSLH